MIKDNNETCYSLYSAQEMSEFITAMGAVQYTNFETFSNEFDFSNYNTLVDIGGSGSFLSSQVVHQHPHMQCISFDLPEIEAIAKANVEKLGLQNQIKCISDDFFKCESFPKADIVVMGNILHDWDEKEKLLLIKKAYDALPVGGSFVVIENIIDNERR